LIEEEENMMKVFLLKMKMIFWFFF